MSLDPRWLHAAHAAADAARAAILPFWRAPEPAAAHVKDAASPIVTEADLAAERAMREVLEARIAEAGVIGEELGATRPGARWQWVLDPIDGTIAFACGKPTFATLIGLLHDGEPVLGIIDQPVLGERWVGVQGQGTTRNGEPVAVRDVPLAQARFATTSPAMFVDPPADRFLEWITEAGHVISWGGDAYNYALLATGRIDLVVERGLALHDWAALVPVVEGAGGTMTTLTGEPLRQGCDGGVVAAGSPALHAAALAHLGV